LFNDNRFDEWAQLFTPRAILTRIERGKQTTTFTLAEALPEQTEYAEENDLFHEVWSNVEVCNYGNIAVIKADYCLNVDHEIREGVDVLTLINEGCGWKINTLSYEQLRLIEK
jgi:putative heme iron utilization protein